MYFRVNLKMKKPMLCCCFTWIVFIELNFTVAFLLIRKTWDDRFVGKVGGMGDFKKWGDDTLLQTMLFFVTKSSILDVPQSLD